MSFGDLAKLVSERWKSISPEDKASYEAKAKKVDSALLLCFYKRLLCLSLCVILESGAGVGFRDEDQKINFMTDSDQNEHLSQTACVLLHNTGQGAL